MTSSTSMQSTSASSSNSCPTARCARCLSTPPRPRTCRPGARALDVPWARHRSTLSHRGSHQGLRWHGLRAICVLSRLQRTQSVLVRSSKRAIRRWVGGRCSGRRFERRIDGLQFGRLVHELRARLHQLRRVGTRALGHVDRGLRWNDPPRRRQRLVRMGHRHAVRVDEPLGGLGQRDGRRVGGRTRRPDPTPGGERVGRAFERYDPESLGGLGQRAE